MIHYVEEDNRLIKESTNDKSKQKNNKQQVTSNNQNNIDLLESHGLSRNARVLTE